MTLLSQDPVPPAALSAAAKTFIRALRSAGAGAFARTYRIEASFTCVHADSLFAAERTLVGLWPDGAARPPSHEVIGLRPTGDAPSMTLAAFDAQGQVLLRRSYSVQMGESGVATDDADPDPGHLVPGASYREAFAL